MRPHLRVATVLDPCSEALFRYEWQSIPVTPDSWRDLLEDNPPDMLLVESVWMGQDQSWFGQVTHRTRGPGEHLIALAAWCRDNNVPTVFWNKEDPPNSDRFIESAKLFDVVFTVDADLIPRYKRTLGHDRVFLLPFSAQPRIHNPIAVLGGRSRDIAFAGSYHAKKHPKRQEQMEVILDPARKLGLEIFSRFDPNKQGDNFTWPEKYRKHIVGSLPYDQMLSVSKMYKVFLNVNSVTESPTMCARRVFELLASGTPLVSGESKAISSFFSPTDLSTCSEPNQTTRELTALLADDDLRTRRSVRGIRSVMNGHTASDRVTEILRAVGKDDPLPNTSVSMVAPTNRIEHIDAILASAARQTQDVELIMLLHGIDESTMPGAELEAKARDLGIRGFEVLRPAADLPLGTVLNQGFSAASGTHIGRIDDDDHYAPNYLADQMNAFLYSDAEIVGKWAHYAYLTGSDVTVLRFAGAEYQYRELILGPTMLMKRDVFERVQFEPLPQGSDTTFLKAASAEGVRTFTTDRMNFVYHRASNPGSHTYVRNDDHFLRQGTVQWDGLEFKRVWV